MLTAAQMRDPFTFIANGYDFAGIWGKSTSGANNGMPVLRAFGDTVYDAYVNVAGSASTTYGTLASLGGLTMTGVNADRVTLHWAGAATTALGVGTYNLTDPSLLSPTSPGGAVYVRSTAFGLAINKAPLTVTANDTSTTYNGLAFAGGNGVSYSGLMNGEGGSVLSGTLTYGGTAQGAVNAGSYRLTASGLTSGNYDITYVDGTLAINKAPLVITANGTSKTYDGLMFSGGNGVFYSGFVNGEGTGVLSGVLTYGGSAQGARNAGTYAVAASGLSAQNYAITWVDGALTINRAVISAVSGITALNKFYDGTTAATLNVSGAMFSGLVTGDSLTIAGARGNFTDASVGRNKTVNITGLMLGGADAGNYILSATTVTATAEIWSATTGGCSQLGAGGGICGVVAPNPAAELGLNNTAEIDIVIPVSSAAENTGAITFGAAKCAGSANGQQCPAQATSH